MENEKRGFTFPASLLEVKVDEYGETTIKMRIPNSEIETMAQLAQKTGKLIVIQAQIE